MDGGNPKEGRAPLISFCIPTYNRKPALERLLANFTRQAEGFGDGVELCISDNGSTDGTREWLDASWGSGARKPPAIGTRLCFSKTNDGIDASLLRLVDMAGGKFLWFMGDDDLILENGFARVWESLNSASPDVLYVPWGSMLDGKIAPMSAWGNQNFSKDLVMKPYTFISSMIVRKELFTRIDRKLLEKGLGTYHVHSWALRLNGLYRPETKVAILGEPPVVLDAGSNRFAPLSWELKVHSRVFAITYLDLLLLPRVGFGYRLKFARELILWSARAQLFILCERVFREKTEGLSFGFFWKEFGPYGVLLYAYRTALGILPRALLSASLRALMGGLRLFGIVKKNSYEFLEKSWSAKLTTSMERLF